jgi:hypothetical protein
MNSARQGVDAWCGSSQCRSEGDSISISPRQGGRENSVVSAFSPRQIVAGATLQTGVGGLRAVR